MKVMKYYMSVPKKIVLEPKKKKKKKGIKNFSGPWRSLRVELGPVGPYKITQGQGLLSRPLVGLGAYKSCKILFN